MIGALSLMTTVRAADDQLNRKKMSGGLFNEAVLNPLKVIPEDPPPPKKKPTVVQKPVVDVDIATRPLGMRDISYYNRYEASPNVYFKTERKPKGVRKKSSFTDRIQQDEVNSYVGIDVANSLTKDKKWKLNLGFGIKYKSPPTVDKPENPIQPSDLTIQENFVREEKNGDHDASLLECEPVFTFGVSCDF